jgi:hypothetical protein
MTPVVTEKYGLLIEATVMIRISVFVLQKQMEFVANDLGPEKDDIFNSLNSNNAAILRAIGVELLCRPERK